MAAVTPSKPVTVEATDSMDAAVAKFGDCDCSALPVTRRGALVGMVTTDNLTEFMHMRAAATNGPIK